MVNGSAEKDYGTAECSSTSALPESKLRHNFRLGDITWVKQSGSSWWPAQVIDEACAGAKPKKKSKLDCLVRLYGTCQYLYTDPWKSNAEFEMMLKQENKKAMEAFREVFQKELSHVNSSGDDDVEAAKSKGGDTKVTSEKTSSRNFRKREGLKKCSHRGVKESATAENQGDETEQYNEEEDQYVGITATTEVSVQKRKRGRVRHSSSSHDKEQTIDKASSESSAQGLRDKRQKHVAQGASMGRREPLRRSARSNAKEYLDTAEDRTAPLTDMGASEDATEDSMVDGTSAPHGQIKAMVRDILFKDIIDREHDAEMAYVDEVINGICNATEDNVTGAAATYTKVGQGVKQSGSRAEGESSNVTHRKERLNQATEDTLGDSSNSLKGIIDTTPSRGAAMKEPGQLSARQIRQIRIMQSLGLIAPSGSPFGRNGVVAATD